MGDDEDDHQRADHGRVDSTACWYGQRGAPYASTMLRHDNLREGIDRVGRETVEVDEHVPVDFIGSLPDGALKRVRKAAESLREIERSAHRTLTAIVKERKAGREHLAAIVKEEDRRSIRYISSLGIAATCAGVTISEICQTSPGCPAPIPNHSHRNCAGPATECPPSTPASP